MDPANTPSQEISKLLRTQAAGWLPFCADNQAKIAEQLLVLQREMPHLDPTTRSLILELRDGLNWQSVGGVKNSELLDTILKRLQDCRWLKEDHAKSQNTR